MSERHDGLFCRRLLRVGCGSHHWNWAGTAVRQGRCPGMAFCVGILSFRMNLLQHCFVNRERLSDMYIFGPVDMLVQFFPDAKSR